MSIASQATRAIVVYEPNVDPISPNLRMENLTVGEPGPKELLVQVLAVGVCHTDISIACRPGLHPYITGHEGIELGCSCSS